jgi:hypothetical protein
VLRLPLHDIELPAVVVASQWTKADDAWSSRGFCTVRLLQPIGAIRVHARAGIAASSKEAMAWGGGKRSCWYAIGDVILTRDDYKRAHALPAGFSYQDEWTLLQGSVLNVGIAGPLFGHAGGAAQAEWLSGPDPTARAIHGYWANKSGNA